MCLNCVPKVNNHALLTLSVIIIGHNISHKVTTEQNNISIKHNQINMQLKNNPSLEFKQEFVLMKEITTILDKHVLGLTNFTAIGSGWFKIENEKTSDIILKIISDTTKKKILTTLMKKTLTIQEIIKQLKMPSTSVYRKCNEMIQDGLVKTTGYFLSSDGKRTYAYHAIINDIKINFDGDIVVFIKIQH